jgi:hypothetical protein
MQNNIPKSKRDDNPDDALARAPTMKGDEFFRFAQAADIVAALDAADSYPFDDEHPYWYTDYERAHWRWRHIRNWEARELVISLYEPADCRERAKQLTECLEELTTELFWLVFLNIWPSICGSWPYQPKLLEMLRYHADQEPAIHYMRPLAIQFFDELPPVVDVFRGCDRGRVLGLSWSPSQRLARGYAAAKHLSHPLLARAKIRRSAIFAVCIGEGDCEIVVDPKHLRQILAGDLV